MSAGSLAGQSDLLGLPGQMRGDMGAGPLPGLAELRRR